MQYCSACLSSDRRLVRLNELREIKPIFKLMNLNFNLSDACVCWECKATFHRIKTFKAQILRAQKILKSYTSKTKKKMNSLSKLCVSKEYSYDITYEVKDEICDEANVVDDNCEEDYVKDLYGFDADEEDMKDEQNSGEEKVVYEVDNEEGIDSLLDNVEEGAQEKENPEPAKDKILAPESEHPPNSTVDPVMKLSKLEEQFLVTRMTLSEVYEARESARAAKVYQRCPHKCEKCVLGYYQEEMFQRHVREKHALEYDGKKRSHKCEICEVTFSRSVAMEHHYEKHFRRYKCVQCEFTHHRLASMLAHKSNEHNAGCVYACDMCDERFDRPQLLRYHKEKHKGRPKCDICGKTSSTKAQLKIHMTIHTGVQLVQCPECGRRVRTLSAHRRTHAPRAEGAYCVECGLQLATEHLYRRHLATSRAHAQHAHRK